MSCGIYKIVEKETNCIYIGQSLNIEQRIKRHQMDAFNSNKPDYKRKLHTAIREKGWSSFYWDIVELCDINELDIRETYWIDFFNSYQTGFNETINGKSRPVSQFDLDGKWIADFTSAADAARQLSLIATNITHCAQGKGKSTGGFQWRYTKDVINRQCTPYIIQQKNNKNSKPVEQWSNNILIAIYPSVSEAARQLHISQANISKACRGLLRQTNGFEWRYHERSV